MVSEKNKKSKIVVIIGPTASGKSALAVSLARRFDGEVISADSRQVYRGLDIGTGKIMRREMRGVPHHLLDVASPRHTFTAAEYVRLAQKSYSSVLQNTRIPIVCGGTGFYIDALLGRISLSNVPPSRALRARLEKKTAAELFAILKRRDPRRAARMNESDRQNPRRLIRALEIASFARPAKMIDLRNQSFDVLWVGITWPEKELRRRIRARLRARMRHATTPFDKKVWRQDMIAEARRLHARGLSYKRMESLGLEYRWLANFLQKKISREEMLQGLECDIWQYAKRQITYWRRNKEIQWFSPKNRKKIDQSVRSFLAK